MQLSKFKITTLKSPGYMMVVYENNHLKSILNEFKPPLTEQQLNIILNRIPDDPNQLVNLINEKYEGKILVEAVKAIGAEPDPILEDYPVNKKIALFCELYEASVGVKYKAGAADAGKLKALAITPDELKFILEVYLASDEWFLKPKSIANFIKKFNECRALAYAKPKPKTFPLPFNELHFTKLSLMDKREYHVFLRANGYEYIHNPVKGGNWVKKSI